MGIRAVRSAPSRGQPCEGIGFTSGSAQWGPGRRPGNRVPSLVPSLEQPVRRSERWYFGQPKRRRQHRRTGDPCSRGCFRRSGNWAVQQLCCSGAPRRCVASSLGKPGGGAKTGSAGPRAVRSMPACRATEATAKTSWRGRPMHEVGFVALGNWGDEVGFRAWATRAVRFERSRGQPRGRASFMASGTMYGARFVVWETG